MRGSCQWFPKPRALVQFRLGIAIRDDDRPEPRAGGAGHLERKAVKESAVPAGERKRFEVEVLDQVYAEFDQERLVQRVVGSRSGSGNASLDTASSAQEGFVNSLLMVATG